jgi:hypothetical protein
MALDFARDDKIIASNSFSGNSMRYQTLFGLQYAFRVRTEAIFEKYKEHIFDFYITDDPKFDEFYLFKNLWRETILLNSFADDRVFKVIKFG